MAKLCLIYNSAPRYREAIYRAIDAEYDCNWYFGKSKSGIKEMDTSSLKNVKFYETFGNPNKFYFKIGILKLLFARKYQTYFMLADIRSITDWIFYLLLFTFFHHKKLYLWTHGWYGKESGIFAKMKLWLYRKATGTFVYGNYARKLLIKEGIPANKLFTIHNSLHYDEQLALRDKMQKTSAYSDHFRNDNPVILFVGRLTTVKKLDMLIKAVSTLKQRGEIYNLVLVGDGSERSTLEDLVSTLGLNEQAWFYGACYDEKINAELIYNADLCVSPGNVGLTAMHSMVFGTPVISHNAFSWQMPEFEAIIPGKTGAFYEYENQEDLVDCISRWFNENQDKRGEIRQNCYTEIDENWTPEYQMGVIKKNIVL